MEDSQIEVKDLDKYFTQDSVKGLIDNLGVEILEVSDSINGLGVFLFDNLKTLAHGEINVAFTASWKMNEQKTEVLEVIPLKCFVFKGDIPDEVLDEMGDVAKLSDKPKWKDS